MNKELKRLQLVIEDQKRKLEDRNLPNKDRKILIEWIKELEEKLIKGLFYGDV